MIFNFNPHTRKCCILYIEYNICIKCVNEFYAARVSPVSFSREARARTRQSMCLGGYQKYRKTLAEIRHKNDLIYNLFLLN